MITDDEVMRLFERADPARSTDDLDNTPDATGYLAALRQRSNNVTYIHPTDTPPDEPVRRPFTRMAIAAAAVVVLVVGALVLAARGDDDDREVPATVPPTVPGPNTTLAPRTTPAPSAVDDPVGKATAFLAAFATGDPATVESLQADTFVMSSGWPREGPPEALAEHEWLAMTYQAGHATNYVDPTCTLSEEADGVAVVECESVMELTVHHATKAPGLGVTVTLEVANDGVVAMESAYARSFSFLRDFDEWREANRLGALPDGDDSDPQTAQESLEYARTEAELVAEWVASATATALDVFKDHNAGDVDAFLARFDQGAAIFGIPATEARGVFAALMAGGQTYETSECAPDGIDRGLAILCDVVIRPPGHQASGVQLGGSIRMIVSADGTIRSDGYTVDSQPWVFNTAFEQWLLAAHPDVHAQITWIEVGEHRIPSADDQALAAQFYDEFVAQSDVYPLGR